MAQCLDLWVLITLQSGQRSVGFIFSSSFKKSEVSGSGFKYPGSLTQAKIKGIITLKPIRDEEMQ